MTTMTSALERGTMTTPDRSLEQRRTALRRANTVRSRRARLKRDLTAGRVTFIELLERGQTDPDLATWHVWDVLLATPKVGRVKARKAIGYARVSPSKTLAGLSDRQRGELRAFIGAHYQRLNLGR